MKVAENGSGETNTSNGNVIHDAECEKGPSAPPLPQRRRVLQRLIDACVASPIYILLVPYIVGIVWHFGLHPCASVLTGDFQNPRRWYIDENSLDPSHFQLYSKYDLILQTKSPSTTNEMSTTSNETVMIASLCHGIRTRSVSSGIDIPCHRHYVSSSSSSPKHTSVLGLDIAKIVPLSAGISPISEAIVLVVPPFVPFLDVRLRPSQHQHSMPMYADKSRLQLQASILQLVRRLASPQTSPWLAKTIFVVSPVLRPEPSDPLEDDNYVMPVDSMSPVLEETVVSFLDAHLGYRPLPSRSHKVQEQKDALPVDFIDGAIIRTMLVLDVQTFLPDEKLGLSTDAQDDETIQTQMSEIRILPHGRRGRLPNMDLTFAVKAILDRSTMLGYQQIAANIKKRYQMVELVVHPYHRQVQSWWNWIQEQVSKDLPSQLLDSLHLLAFESILAIGPYPPHAPALDRGIDSITIQASFVAATDSDDYDEVKGNNPRTKLSPQQYPMELIQRTELILRALSNLHERLHHSTSLYLLVSKDRFVKHEEFLIPNLLLVIPLLLRAIWIVYQKDFRPHFTAAFEAGALSLSWMVAALLLLDNDNVSHVRVGNTINIGAGEFGIDYKLVLLYFGCLFLLSRRLVYRATASSMIPSDLNAKRQSIQFIACLVAALIHVSIAFGHVALSYPSAMLWTPLLAFPTLSNSVEGSKNKNIGRLPRLGKALSFMCAMVLAVALCPYCFLVPHVFQIYTPYVRYAYTPLHVLFCFLHIIPVVVSL